MIPLAIYADCKLNSLFGGNSRCFGRHGSQENAKSERLSNDKYFYGTDNVNAN